MRVMARESWLPVAAFAVRGSPSDFGLGSSLRRTIWLSPPTLARSRALDRRQPCSLKPARLTQAPPSPALAFLIAVDCTPSRADRLAPARPDDRDHGNSHPTLGMQPSPLAGPSSPRALSLASGPPPPASASPLPLPVPEPYDSSLKPYPKPTARSNAPSTYAAGGQETDGPDGDEQEGGDLGVRARSSPVRTRDKGKQRAVEPDYAHVRSASGDVVLDMRPDEDDDDVEAIEERRIQEVRPARLLSRLSTHPF